MKKAIIIPQRIWDKEVNVKGKTLTKSFVKYGNCIFSCFGSLPENIKEGKKCKIEYDEMSKYVSEDEDGKATFFFNLIKQKASSKETSKSLSLLEKRIEDLEKRVLALERDKDFDNIPSAEPPSEEEDWEGYRGIPIINDQDE